MRQALAPVVRVLPEADIVVRPPLLEDAESGADAGGTRLEIVVAMLLARAGRVDAHVLGQKIQPRAVRLRELELDLQRVQHRDLGDAGEERAARRLVGGVEQIVEGVFHILRRHLLAVVEGDVVAQFEGVGLLVGRDHRQGLGELRLQHAVDIVFDQVLEHGLAEHHGIVIELVNRIDGDRIARQDDGQRLAIVRLGMEQARGQEAAQGAAC